MRSTHPSACRSTRPAPNEFLRQAYLSSREEWRRIDPEWLRFAGRLTLMQEMDINNRSLVLAIELVESGRVLLFPADAQELNWRSGTTTRGRSSRPPARLTTSPPGTCSPRTVSTRVSHHGSAPGNPTADGLELRA